MSTIETPPGCRRWQRGEETKNPPVDRTFLEQITAAGFVPLIGPSGLCGGAGPHRSILAIHRGGGVRWEMVFQDNGVDMVTTTTTNLNDAAETAIFWLRGGALAVDENAVHAMAG